MLRKNMTEQNNNSLIEASVDEFKQELNDRIISAVRERKMTHNDVAKLISGSRPKITRVLNRNLEKVSLEFLLRILYALKIKTNISFES